MRLPDEQVRQGIVHPEFVVRDFALRWFAKSFSGDPEVMPQVIRAVETFGWNRAFNPWLFESPMTQTKATVAWLVAQLQTPLEDLSLQVHWKRWTERLSRQLALADLCLLAPHVAQLDSLLWLEAESRNRIDDRLRLLTVDAHACWRELEQLCEKEKGHQAVGDFPEAQAENLVEAITRDGTPLADSILRLIDERIEDFESNPQFWMQAYAIELAGQLRMQEAVPSMIERMIEDLDYDGDWVCEKCCDALVRIGTDEVVRAIGRVFADESWEFRLFAWSVLERIHSDLSLSTAKQLLPGENERDVRTGLAAAIVAQLDPESLEVVRGLVVKRHHAPDFHELEFDLTAAGLLTGKWFSERDTWQIRAREEFEDRLELYNNELEALPDEEDDSYDDEPLDEGFDDDFEPDFEFIGSSNENYAEPSVTVTHDEARVGRNDPCPCGSGKKFKKCCMNKPGAAEGESW